MSPRLFAVSIFTAVILPAQTPATVNAVWVDSASLASNPVTDPSAQQTLIQNTAASGVNMLYLSVYSSTKNSDGLHMYASSAIASLISAAHSQNIQVYAQYGDPDWPATGCGASASPMSRLADVNSYNTLNPAAAFDGVMLDVEPPSPVDFTALLALYQCLQQQTQSYGFGLGAAISAFWNTPASGSGELPYQQIVDLGLNMIVIMGYRNFAGNMICPPTPGNQGDGIVCLDQAVISYANTSQSATSILVGLETNVESAANQVETFYSLGQAAMDAAEQSVSSQFAAATPALTFSGFAIDNYQSSWLSGTIPGWPATNPTILQSVPTQVFPHVAADTTWQTDFVILNTSAAPVTFTLNLYPDSGTTIPIAGLGAVSQITGTVDANGTAFYTTDATGDSDGWAELQSAAPLTGVAVFREANDQTSVLLSTPTTNFAVPFDSTALPNAPFTPYVDGLAIANSDATNAASITCQAYDENGNALGGLLSGLAVPPSSHMAFLLQSTAPFSTLPANTRGQLVCQSTTNVSAVELRALGAQVSTMPVVTAGIGSGTGAQSVQVFPHVAADTSWQTDFVILNTASEPVDFTLTLYPDSGTTIPVAGLGAVSQITGTVPAYGTAFYTTDATADSDGWAELESSAPLSGVAVFRETNDQTSVLLSTAATGFTVPFDSTAPPNAPSTPYVDGLAIANADSANPASITCQAYDSNGNVLAASLAGPTIPPLGHTAFLLQSTAPFTSLPSDTRGQLVCTSTTTVSAVELRALGAQVSTMPVVTGQ